MFEATQFAWFNGEIVERERAAPSIASHSLHLGIGVFDGLMAYFNTDHYYLHYVDAHLERLRQGSAKMGLPFSWSVEDLKRGIFSLLEREPQATYYIRPIVYRSVPQINITDSDKMPVDVAIFGVKAPRDINDPISCHISPIERVSGRAIPVAWKICGTYVNSYLVRRSAEEAGFKDGIMLDQTGRITEASAANLFFLTDESLVTPALTSEIFPGITRCLVIELAQKLGIKVIERDIFANELNNFNAVFLTSTLMELRPISYINTSQYNSEKHSMFVDFTENFRKITHQ